MPELPQNTCGKRVEKRVRISTQEKEKPAKNCGLFLPGKKPIPVLNLRERNSQLS
jgi:hypothetical protein